MSTQLHPIAMVLTMSAQAQSRCRPQFQSGVQVYEYLLIALMENGGTNYKAEISLGFGQAAAVAASHKARLLSKGIKVTVHAERERIVLGKAKHILLMGVDHLEPLHMRSTARFYEAEPAQLEAAA